MKNTSPISIQKLGQPNPISPATAVASRLYIHLPAHLPQSMLASVTLLPNNARLFLFTRHSLREPSDKNGFASYQLPLTPNGCVLAKAWGRWLATNLAYSLDVYSLSSPIPRCLDTAKLMQAGAGISRPIISQPLLVEPGSLVTDVALLGGIFREIGALSFINRFLAGQLVGTKTTAQGGLDLLRLFYDHQPAAGELRLAVSHDTLLAAFLAIMMQSVAIDWNDWPKMMEGVFLWFDDLPFEQASVHFIWRGQGYQRSISELLSQIPSTK